jgi:RNA polymerase sigma factor (sigma-70 family)
MTKEEQRDLDNLHASEIIDRHRHGDKSAFPELVAMYQVELIRFNTKICANVADAEDAAQEIWLIMLDSFDTTKYLETQCFSGWLFNSAKFYILKLKRGNKDIVVITDAVPEVIVELLEEADYKEELLEMLLIVRGELNEEEALIIKLRVDEGLQWKVIDEQMALNVGLAAKKYERLLVKLRSKFGKNLKFQI